jgi:hypothetical protein
MNSSPITTWDGAEAYFTFADNPGVIGFLLTLAVVITVGVVVRMVYMERHAERGLRGDE